MPNVVLEAMAAAKPVVATQVEGLEELVDSGRTGWLVPVDDATALAEAIGRLLSDSAGATAMGNASQDYCREEFAVDQFVDRHVQLFRQFGVKSRRRGSPESKPPAPEKKS